MIFALFSIRPYCTLGLGAAVTMLKTLICSLIFSGLVATTVASVAIAQTASPNPAVSENPQDIKPSVANKRLVISKLKSIQTKQVQLIGEIDDKLKNKLKSTQDLRMTDDTVSSELRMTRLQESMELFDQKRREAVERSQFLDRLIFAVDTKWTKDSIKTFLEQTLLDIASAEMNQTDSKTSSSLWKFATYLSVAIRELSEPREDIISFIDNYMEFSTVLAPKPPTAFSQARSYTNGVTSEAAKVANKEDLGDGVEKKVKVNTKEEPAAVVQGTTSAPIEPALPPTIPPNAANPEPTASQNNP